MIFIAFIVLLLCTGTFIPVAIGTITLGCFGELVLDAKTRAHLRKAQPANKPKPLSRNEKICGCAFIVLTLWIGFVCYLCRHQLF